MTLYKKLAQHFILEIQNQQRIIGSRLPALRIVVKQHQVSMTTAKKAYDYLQETGWIFAKPQSGYFVSSNRSTISFPTEITATIEKRDPRQFAQNNKFSHNVDFFCELGIAMISPELTPKIALQRCISRITRRSIDGLFYYPENRGNRVLRKALSNHFTQDNFTFSSDDLIITHGCLDAVRLAIETTTHEGDTIAINSPNYSGLLDLLSGLSRNIIEVPCHNAILDIKFLEELMQTKTVQAALLSTTHINPTGNSLSIHQKQKLAQLAEIHQIPIIEDDVYFELSHQKHTPLPLKTWDRMGYVLWCGSASKTLAPGLRIGWCLPGRFIDKYQLQQSLTDSGVNHLTQNTLAEFINTGEYRSHVNKLRIKLNRQIHQYREFLLAHLPRNSTISLPDGGLVLWVHIPSVDMTQIEQLAKKHKIDILSGHLFSTHKTYNNCFRINCGWPLEDINTKLKLRTLCQIIRIETTR